MNNEILDLEMRLLVLKYGRCKVRDALAQLGEQVPEEVRTRLATAEGNRSVKKQRPTAVELAAKVCAEKPELSQTLRALAGAYDNRTFLPNLRDVGRFLDRLMVPHGKLKSRETAIPTLLRALSCLPPPDLIKVLADNKPRGESDYSILARAIMGESAKPAQDKGAVGSD